jgi:hypothetical protein
LLTVGRLRVMRTTPRASLSMVTGGCDMEGSS